MQERSVHSAAGEDSGHLIGEEASSPTKQPVKMTLYMNSFCIVKEAYLKEILLYASQHEMS